MRSLFIVLLFALTLVPGLHAGNILIFEDYVLGTSAIPGALTLYGACGTCTTTTDTTAFLTALSGSTWDLVIYAEQNEEQFADVSDELGGYLASGGKIIGQTFADGSFATFMGATYQSGNGTSITTTSDPVFAGLGSTIALANPGSGWGIFSVGWNPVTGATGFGTLNSGGYAVILGNGGNTYLNAPLTDIYVATADGERLLANEIGLLLGDVSDVPEPGTLALMGIGFGALVLVRRRLM